MIKLNDWMTLAEAADRYGVSLRRVRYRIDKLKNKPELLEQLIASEVVEFSSNKWHVTTKLMDSWFVKKENLSFIFPQKVREYVGRVSDLEELTELKRLIERRQMEFNASDDYVAKLALKLNSPYHVAVGFVQLAEVIGVNVAAMQIKNWKGKRLYYKDPRRSKSVHREGLFYYCLISKRFIEPYREEEGQFGIEEHEFS